MEFLDWLIRVEMFTNLPGILGMVITFPSYEVLFLTSYSPFAQDALDLVDGFLYF